MSLLDWVEVGGLSAHKELMPVMKGSFGVTIGDAVAGFFGARHAHIFGGELKLVCDPEDMVLGKLEHYLPLTTALLGGVGGQTTFVYGSNTSATYVGPKMDIRRAPHVDKQTDYVLARVGSPPTVNAVVDPIDASMLAAVTVLSVLVVCVPAALELAIRFKYPSFGSSSASEETLEGYGETPAILKLCAFAITSRLMAFLKNLEESGTWAEFAEFWSKVATYLGECFEAFGTACVNLGGRIAAAGREAGAAIAAAARDAAAAIAALGEDAVP